MIYYIDKVINTLFCLIVGWLVDRFIDKGGVGLYQRQKAKKGGGCKPRFTVQWYKSYIKMIYK